MSKKLLVSNKKALVDKYGALGFEKVDSALKKMISSDKDRGFETTLLYVDDADSCSSFGVQPTTKGGKPREVKRVIDSVFENNPQEYICLIGGDEIIPFFRFRNPLYDPTLVGDTDEFIPTDNPYASSASYRRSPDNFLIPDRSLGRLPDETGRDVNEPTLLLNEIEYGVQARPVMENVFELQWGYSAKEWEEASKAVTGYLSISSSRFHLSPPLRAENFDVGYASDMLLHYFNLHGSATDAEWYGQNGYSFPEAYAPDIVEQMSVHNSIIATEACYGGDILDRKIPDSITMTYLNRGCVGFVGSTNIAYGPLAPPNTDADLIAKYFLKAIQEGRSTGSALTEAKIRLSEEAEYYGEGLDDSDYKTLFQFVLYGDPSIHPVQSPSYPKMFVAQVDKSTIDRARLRRRAVFLSRARDAKRMFPKVLGHVKMKPLETPKGVQGKFQQAFLPFKEFKPVFVKRRGIEVSRILAKRSGMKEEEQKFEEYAQMGVTTMDKEKRIIYAVVIKKEEKFILKKILVSR